MWGCCLVFGVALHGCVLSGYELAPLDDSDEPIPKADTGDGATAPRDDGSNG